MPALSYFSVMTWFAPKNVVVANLVNLSKSNLAGKRLRIYFGVSSGLGLFPLTFDWAQIAYIGSPLLTPFWAAANVIGGLVIVMWIIAPIMCSSSSRSHYQDSAESLQIIVMPFTLRTCLLSPL